MNNKQDIGAKDRTYLKSLHAKIAQIVTIQGAENKNDDSTYTFLGQGNMITDGLEKC